MGVIFLTSIYKHKNINIYKHKKLIFSATIHLTRKKFIFPGRYLKVDQFEKKLDMGGGPFKNAKG